MDLVPRLRLRRPRTAIERLYPIRRISVFTWPAADLVPLGQPAALATCESRRKGTQMQLVELPHDREVGLRHARGR